MKLFAVVFSTNYGDRVALFNAESEEEVKEMCRGNEAIWDGYTIEEVDIKTKGLVLLEGGG